MNDDDNNTLNHWKAFCEQLLHLLQNVRSYIEFTCGSSIEIPNRAVISKKYHINEDMIDVDEMRYWTSLHAANHLVKFPEAYNGVIIRIHTGEVHTGYARLIREKDNVELQMSDLYTQSGGDIRHGPAILIDSRKNVFSENYSLSNVNDDTAKLKQILNKYIDSVYAVHSPFWPVEALEWITRTRFHDVPSKSVIKQVIKYGCDFVQVSHNRLNNNGEWRFSFSKAETFIIKKWTISQRVVYACLWILNKKMIASDNLCTYFFKTLMFWACEERSASFWSEDFLVPTVCELLIELMKWVKDKYCANYFIPGNNIMDHLIETNLSYEIDALWRFSQSTQFISEITATCQQYVSPLANRIYCINSPAWITRAYVIPQWIHNCNVDICSDLFHRDLTTDLQTAVYAELVDIYIGLCCQRNSSCFINMSNKHINFLKSERHLQIVVNLCQSHERDVIENCSLEFYNSMTDMFMPYHINADSSSRHCNFVFKHTFAADRESSLDSCNEQKCLLYFRSMLKQENQFDKDRLRINENRSVQILVEPTVKGTTESYTDVEFFKEWPGRSPTVNMSWFIANAYLANLYYTTQRDISFAMKTCDDIISVYKHSLMNQQFAEKTFPVVLSTQWTSIYDRRIQEVLGFYSICSFVLDKLSRRSVYIGVCPVLFALYLRLRIVTETTKEWFSNKRATGYIMEWHRHIKTCQRAGMINDGTFVIMTVIGIVHANQSPSNLFLQTSGIIAIWKMSEYSRPHSVFDISKGQKVEIRNNECSINWNPRTGTIDKTFNVTFKNSL